jgi:hypothetical protein
MNYLELLEKKASEHEEKEMCWSLNYLVGYGADRDFCEINGSESYCDDCIDNKIEEIQLLLTEKGSKYIHDEFDCSRDDIDLTEISYMEESSPETDNFETCYNCGKSIHTGVLHTLSQEIEHYLDDSENLKIADLSNQDCFRIKELTQSEDSFERHPELVEKLKQKLREHNAECVLM